MRLRAVWLATSLRLAIWGAWLDRTLLGGHLWKPDWDPEGLLSTLPAVGSTLLGVAAGVWIRATRPPSAAPALVLAGLALTVAGLVWDLTFPINKSLWTSSYVLFTGGTAAIVLGVLHRGLDDGRFDPADQSAHRARRRPRSQRDAAVRAVGPGGQDDDPRAGRARAPPARRRCSSAIYQTAFVPLLAPRNASLLYALTSLALLYALLAWLHRRRWYWSV